MTPGATPLSCSRCFRVFDAPDGLDAAVPLCADCAARVRPAPAPTLEDLPPPRRRPPGLAAGLALLAVAAAVLGGFAWFRRPPPPPPAVPPAARVEDRVGDWRAAGLVPAEVPADARALAARRVLEGEAALREDLPARTREALAAFREALAADPSSAAAAAGFAEAVAGPLDLMLYEAPLPLGAPQISLYWHSRHDRNPAHGWIRDHIRQVCAPLQA